MRNFTSRKSFTFGNLLTGGIVALSLLSNIATAQTPQVRKYASRVASKVNGIVVLPTFSDLPNAIDGDPQTSSNMTIGLGIGGSIEELIDFNPDASATAAYATTITGTTPITVKVKLPAGLLSALSGIEVSAITDLHRTGSGIPVIDPFVWEYTDVGTAYSGASILGLLSGAGETEITIVPGADYQGIRVRLVGLASLAFGADVYDVYVKEDAVGAIACDERLDVLSGVTSNDVANLASGLGSVQDPMDAIDGDTTTFSQLNMGVQVLNATYLTAIFNGPSKLGDSINIMMRDDAGSLLNLGLLNAFTIELYDGPTLTKTINNNSSLLTLDLLSSGSDKYVLRAAITDAIFDRIEIKYGGVASLLATMRVYEIGRKIASPITDAEKDVYVYAGQSATLASTPALGDVVTWYDADVAGNMVANPVATTVAQDDTTINYYAQASRNGCTETSDFVQANLHIIGITNDTTGVGEINVAYNGSVAVTPQGSLPIAPVYAYALNSGSLPTGLGLDGTSGQISGTPTVAGTFPFDVAVDDQANNLAVGIFAYNLVISAVPLPITLLSFNAGKENGSCILNWKTATEQNNKGFDIERSIDGKQFTKIGYQRSLAQNGNSDGTLAYSFTDAKPSAGVNYYRLKQTDLDGKVGYSKVVNVTFGAGESVKLYPNPAHNVVTVEASSVKSIELYNILGQKVNVPVTYGNNINQLNTSGMAKGNYSVRVITETGTTTSKLVLK